MARTVTINPALPLRVTVDLQSKHATLWRLFIRPDATAAFTFLKEGSEDGTAVIPQMPVGGSMLVEFVYMPDPGSDFRAVLVFEQSGGVIAIEPFTAPGGDVVLQDQVDFV